MREPPETWVIPHHCVWFVQYLTGSPLSLEHCWASRLDFGNNDSAVELWKYREGLGRILYGTNTGLGTNCNHLQSTTPSHTHNTRVQPQCAGTQRPHVVWKVEQNEKAVALVACVVGSLETIILQRAVQILSQRRVWHLVGSFHLDFFTLVLFNITWHLQYKWREKLILLLA